MQKRGKLLFPGDKGFNDEKFREYGWNWVREMSGLEPKRGAKIEIHGFVVNDFRTDPPISIWKNCRFPLSVGFKPPVQASEPIPFQYLEEAMAYKKSMNLSMDDEEKVKVTALCPAPGLGEPMPDTLFMDKKDMKGR